MTQFDGHSLRHAKADVVVIGGGPAGAAAAATVARAGLAATLFAGGTPSQWIETVPVEVTRLLPELGIPPVALSRVATPCHWHGAAYSPALHVDRAPLDAMLRSAAGRAGADVYGTRAVATIREGGRLVGVRDAAGLVVSCRAVIDASGARAWLSRQLALRTQSLSPPLIAWRGELEGPPNGREDGAAEFHPSPLGWLFTVTWRGRTTWTATGSGRRRPDISPLSGKAPAAACNVSWRLARPTAGRGWLLAGEAAGRLDPAWGQGLMSAILSGIAAGRTAAACLTDPPNESVYLAAYDGWFADRIHEAAAGLRRRYADNAIRLVDPERAAVA